jgi:hypothetical protein
MLLKERDSCLFCNLSKRRAFVPIAAEKTMCGIRNSFKLVKFMPFAQAESVQRASGFIATLYKSAPRWLGEGFGAAGFFNREA